jgi:nucleoid DNA-binding protein
MNKTDIVERLAGRLGHSKAETRRLLDAHIEAIAHHLAIGNRVVLRGLGSLDTHEVPGHHGRRPTDGEALEIPPRRQVTFRASERLREEVQGWEPAS